MVWWAWLLAAWRNRKQIQETAEAVEEVIEAVVHDGEQPTPMTHALNEHNRAQERSAIAAAKAANAAKAAPAPVDREAVTPPGGRPIPPLPPSKRS